MKIDINLLDDTTEEDYSKPLIESLKDILRKLREKRNDI